MEEKNNGKQICRHWLNGRCNYGDACRFAHSGTPVVYTAAEDHSSSGSDIDSGRQCESTEVVEEDSRLDYLGQRVHSASPV